MPIENLPIVVGYNVQRFKQFCPQDCANWYVIKVPNGKKNTALYPVMGRRHISFLNENRLEFLAQARGIFKSINFWYAVVANNIYRIDAFFNIQQIANASFSSLTGDVQFAYLPVPIAAVSDAVPTVYAAFVDGNSMWVYDENSGSFDQITDSNMPALPSTIATFGNRFVVGSRGSTEFRLTEINLRDGSGVYNPNTIFTINGEAVFAQESGVIRQMAVLHNTLYIFTDYTTGIWSNNPSTIPTQGGGGISFPWKKNTAYDWDYGIAQPNSLDVDFGMMVWLAQNRNGVVTFMMSNGQSPKPISDQAINTLLQKRTTGNELSPFLAQNVHGFLYQWENSIFYRASAGQFLNVGVVDLDENALSLEFCFDAGSWQRCIELNGERNRIEQHVFFANRHYVTVQDDTTIYEMAGNFYSNEVRNPEQPDVQAADAYIAYPFRYELVTPLIFNEDYSEFVTDYVEIDFVWGEETFVRSDAPFANTQFIIDEEATGDGEPIYLTDEDGAFLITEESNTPQLNELTYNAYFKPHIELYFSDDGGVSFLPADVRQFSDIGYYRWRMRWYQLGASRNRCYKLVCVSPSPIVVLGAVMERRRISGGAN